MAKQQIGLLFGVQGSGKLSGESGQLILQQLNKIARSIDNTNNRMKVTIGVNEAQTRQLIQKQLNNISKGLKITIGGNTNATQGAQKQVRDLTRQVQNAQNKLASMGGNYDATKYGNVKGITKELQTYTDAVKEAKAADDALHKDSTNRQLQQEVIDKVRIATNAQKQLNAALNDSTALDKQSLNYNKVIARITEYQAKNKETLKNTPKLAAQLEELNQQLAGGTFKGTKTDAQNEFLKITNKIREAGGEAETLGQKVKRVFSQKFGYGIMATAAMYARRVFKEVYQSVVEVDSALTQLSIVTGKSMSTLREHLDGIADSAKEANSSIKDMLSSMETYSRLGYNLNQSESMAKITNMYANVAATDAKTATSSLTAILKGYGYDPSQLEGIADILVKVGQEYAISAEELGTGLQTAGATLSITGTNLEKSVALLTAGNAAIKCVSHSAAMYYKKVA